VRFEGPAQRRAVLAFDDAVETVARAKRSGFEQLGPLQARVGAAGPGPAVRVEMAREGKIFGGSYALELSTDDPVLPPSRGLSVRARGIVRMRGVRMRARRGDEAGRRIAERLETSPELAEALGSVDFERIRIEPDGRAVIRHLGGSVVWILFPPLIRQIPLIPEQAAATLAALDAFADAGRRA
jgi:hypothetical protein